jgi:hypothetical protein
MKRFTLSGLALVLALGNGMALADRDDWHGDHSHGWYGPPRGYWYPRYPHPVYRPVYVYPQYYYHDHHDHHDHDDYYVPLGAALIGAAVTYSIVHSHDTSYSGSGGSSDVVGCHRVERYPDGSEHRVEVPIADCY